MAKKIEWNPEHKSSDEQEMAFRLDFITWSAQKRWEYLMKLCTPPKNEKPIISKRRIEWK